MNIQRLLDVFEDSEYIFLVFEPIKGKSLSELIDQDKKLSEFDAMRIFTQILDGLSYLHAKGIIHRELTPESIFLASAEDYSTVKISNLQFACFKTDCAMMKLRCGFPGYMAPEVLNLEFYDEKSDVFCLGLIFHAMYTKYFRL
jgi:serine/threonine protein kinase